MEILKMVLMILFAIDCIALTVIVLLQEGKSAGLGTIGGYLLGTEQGTFHGRNTCKVHEVFSNSFRCTGSSIELECICLKKCMYESEDVGTLL